MGNALACHTAESREQPWPEAARSTVATGRTRKHTPARHARNRAFNSAKANMCSAIWPSISSSVGVQRRCGLPGGTSMSRHACKKRQRLQLTIAAGRKRANAPRFVAILMSWTCQNPIIIRLAGRPPQRRPRKNKNRRRWPERNHASSACGGQAPPLRLQAARAEHPNWTPHRPKPDLGQRLQCPKAYLSQRPRTHRQWRMPPLSCEDLTSAGLFLWSKNS